MIAKLFSDGEPVGHCEVDNDTSVIILGVTRHLFYIFNAQTLHFEQAKAQYVKRVEWTPIESASAPTLLSQIHSFTPDLNDPQFCKECGLLPMDH